MAGMIIPAEYEGSVCEIKTTENTFITTARVSSVSSDKIKFSIKGRAFRSVSFGTRVKINIINSIHGFRVLEGKVFTYSFGTLTLTDIRSIAERERRRSLRVDINASAKAAYENTLTGRTSFVEITVRDLSLNGVKFTSRVRFDIGSRIIFGLDLGRTKYMDITCSVMRRGSESAGGEMSYVARLESESGQEDDICSYLLQKQGELYKKSK